MPTSIGYARQRSKTHGTSLLFVLLLLLNFVPLAALPAAGDSQAPSPNTVVLGDDTLTVRLTKASLRHTLEEFGRLSHAEIVWLQPVGEDTVSAAFTALPVPEALARLLKGKNFLLFYTNLGKGEKLSQVWISSRPEKKATLPGRGFSLVSPHSVVRSSAALQTGQSEEDHAAGEFSLSSLSTDEVVQIALGEKHPSLRLDAIALLGQEVHESPRLTALLSRIAREDPDPAARQIAALTLGETAE